MCHLPTRDYAEIADALEGINPAPLVDDVGRKRCMVLIHPDVLRYVCKGLRRLSQILASPAL